MSVSAEGRPLSFDAAILEVLRQLSDRRPSRHQPPRRAMTEPRQTEVRGTSGWRRVVTPGGR
jgi:hypothetical protein